MLNTSWRRIFYSYNRLPLFFILFVVVVVSLAHIGSQPPHLSPAGAAERSQSSSLSQIYHTPLNGPHKLLVLAASHIGSSAGTLRYASFIAAFVFAVCFYLLAKSLFGRLVGCLAAIIFCVSPFFIIPARQVSPAIMLFAPVALFAVYSWFIKTEKKSFSWLALVLAAGLLIYTPGVIYWIIGGAIFCRRKIKESLMSLPSWTLGAGAAMFLLLLVPACVSLIHNWHQLNGYFLIPQHWPAPLAAFKNLGWMILALFIRTPHGDQLTIGRLPLLDIMQTALVVFGAFAIWSAARLKLYAYGVSVLFAVVAAAVNGDIKLLFLGLSALGLLMAAGLRFLYIEWRGVFPRNPIAKYLALLFMICLMAAQVVYGFRYSLQAWPATTATKNTYVLK